VVCEQTARCGAGRAVSGELPASGIGASDDIAYELDGAEELTGVGADDFWVSVPPSEGGKINTESVVLRLAKFPIEKEVKTRAMKGERSSTGWQGPTGEFALRGGAKS
jgi:hypothetical protein